MVYLTRTVSVRLPAGVYKALKELATLVEIDISGMANFLLGVGLGYAKLDRLSESTMALLQADLHEAQAGLLRAYANTPKHQREKSWKDFEAMMGRLTSVLREDSQ